MPETHELLTMDEAREAYDNATIHAHGMMFGEGEDKSMAADAAFATLRDAILTAARESDAAARIAAQREAASRAWDAGWLVGARYPDRSFITAGSPAIATREAYLDREHPLPARECVLSDGSVVTYAGGFFRVNGEVPLWSIDNGRVQSFRDFAITGADFEKLKAFAAGVGR